MSREKSHKKMCVKMLRVVAYWIEESKTDYRIEDLKSLLKEATNHYQHYLDVKKDPTHYPDFEPKSYK